MLALEDHWVWDSWYLQAPKSIGDPALRHWNVTQGHSVSDDLVTWEHRGTSLAPAEGPAWDDKTTWTGSTLRGDDGCWHYFYTGTSAAEGALIQRIGHAVGEDLETWERVGDGLCLDLTGPNAAHYETDWEGAWHDRAMRDPWVMKDPDGPGWLMYFTARAAGIEETNDAGCIGIATSPDLMTWTLEPPVFTGGWGQLEVPQVLQIDGGWHCLFCMDPEHQARWNAERHGRIGRGTHYLVSESPRGPWRLPEGDALDTKVLRYAARIVKHDGLKLLGFKDGGPDGFGGYIMDPAPVFRRADGTLSLER